MIFDYISDFCLYLECEKGLSLSTISSYRQDLSQVKSMCFSYESIQQF